MRRAGCKRCKRTAKFADDGGGAAMRREESRGGGADRSATRAVSSQAGDGTIVKLLLTILLGIFSETREMRLLINGFNCVVILVFVDYG